MLRVNDRVQLIDVYPGAIGTVVEIIFDEFHGHFGNVYVIVELSDCDKSRVNTPLRNLRRAA